VGRMPNRTKLALAHNPYGSVPALLHDCVDTAVDALVVEAGGPTWDTGAHEGLREAVRPQLERAVEDLVGVVGSVLAAAEAVEQRLRGLTHPLLQDAVGDIREQLAGLVGPGFVSRTGRHRLDHVLRYLQAVERRLDRLSEDVERDRRAMRIARETEQEYRDVVTALPPGRRAAPEVVELRWLLEELRVSLFAQPMKTAVPVSEKRVLRALDALVG
jgi:ATP-dependent helicase HrpA